MGGEESGRMGARANCSLIAWLVAGRERREEPIRDGRGRRRRWSMVKDGRREGWEGST